MNINNKYDNDIIKTIKLVISENQIINNIKFIYINSYYNNSNECYNLTNKLINENVNVIFMGLSFNCLLEIKNIIKENDIYWL